MHTQTHTQVKYSITINIVLVYILAVTHSLLLSIELVSVILLWTINLDDVCLIDFRSLSNRDYENITL